jgi:hypothetical protein
LPHEVSVRKKPQISGDQKSRIAWDALTPGNSSINAGMFNRLAWTD